MASRGRRRKVRPRGSSRPLPCFDQHAFVATGAAVTTIAHTSAAGGQGGSSDLQRFSAYHPSTFRGGGDQVVVDHWFRQVKRVLKAMEITSDVARIRLMIFQL